MSESRGTESDDSSDVDCVAGDGELLGASFTIGPNAESSLSDPAAMGFSRGRVGANLATGSAGDVRANLWLVRIFDDGPRASNVAAGRGAAGLATSRIGRAFWGAAGGKAFAVGCGGEIMAAGR